MRNSVGQYTRISSSVKGSKSELVSIAVRVCGKDRPIALKEKDLEGGSIGGGEAGRGTVTIAAS